MARRPQLDPDEDRFPLEVNLAQTHVHLKRMKVKK